MFYYIDDETIYCDVCGRIIKAEEVEGGYVFVHDDVPHDILKEVRCQ